MFELAEVEVKLNSLDMLDPSTLELEQLPVRERRQSDSEPFRTWWERFKSKRPRPGEREESKKVAVP